MKTTTPAKLNVPNLLRLVFLMFAVLSVTQNFAQSQNAQIDLELQQLVRKKQLSEDQAKNYVITAQHTSSTSGIEHIYFNQTLNGLRIIGTESSIHLYNGKKLKFNENLISGRALSTAGSSSPSISAENAIRAIARNMGYRTSNLQEKERIGGVNQETIFNTGGISKKDIPAKLAYQINENNEVELAWEISIEDINSSEDWWVFAVNAASGSIINKYNLFNNCNILDEHNDLFHSGVPSKLNGASNKKTDFSAYLKVESPAEESAMVASYNVYAMPDESPHHGSMGRQIVSGIEGTGSPFGWHDTDGSAGAEFTVTTGNNVDSRKGTIRADGGASLTFNTPHDLTMEPTTADNVLSATVNLFYWNNITHDLLWEYGFNEASGNFQENNYGNGGLGSDSVNANAQATGNCNANFGTPIDGLNPEMNMFNCNIATPSRDGDFDNGVIVHEYAHGISNRLTGGAAAVNCLNNSEQMGEGWSDFYGLVMTIEPGDAGTDARGIGTWLLGTGPNGPGVRTERYSTDMSIYTKTYANLPTAVVPHGVGEIWAEMLWEMTWGLIADHGVDANIYNFTGDVSLDKGNVMAFALVTEGLKLQPCSPGFVDGRDAILAADVALYGGANACTIWEAFAKRGLGFSADQGSTSSKSDGTAAFDLPPNFSGFDAIDTICETQGTQTGLSGGTPAGGTYSGSGVTDNGDGTFDFDPTVGGPGDTIVTYTVLSPCSGLVEDIEDTIVVTSGVPIIPCEDITLTLDGLGMAVYNPSFSAPSSLVVIGGNNGSNSAGTTTLQVTVSEAVNVSFDWLFESSDSPGWDDFGYTLNGMFTNLSNGASYPATGNANVALNIGDVFEFTVRTDDNTFGAATATITNFSPLFAGQFATANWTEVLTNSDGSTSFGSLETLIENSCGNPFNITISQTVFTCNDIGDNIVTITADNGFAIGTCEAVVTIIGPTSTWNGGWDVAPDANRKALFNANYNTSAGDITACSCEVAMGSTVTVDAGGFLDINGNIKVGAGSTLLVEHEGSVRQMNDDATVTNDGTISVLKTTPAMAAKSFMVSGSPMTGETREGVFDPAYIVRHHVTGNFIPNVDVEAVSPGINNWADDNGNNWLSHTGGLNPGEGYMVFPQPNGTSSGSYTQTHSLGTLNNGVVDFNIGYNGSQNASPNILANPYASAIDVEEFFDHPSNSNIDVVYFWEHITALSAGYPGYNVENFNMGDISLYSESLAAGVSAANGAAIPTQFIASGQGFGVKPTAGGIAQFNNAMRVTGPNDSYRSSDSVNRDRLWMNVYNDTYGLGSTTLIGFTENTSDGFIISEDVHRLPTPVSLYSELETGEELVVNALGTFETSDAIYLSFTTQVKETQDYRISIQDIDGINLENASVYIIDSLTGSVTNLKEGDYTFQSGEAVYHNRFKVVFEYSALGINDSNLDSVSLYPNPTQKTVTIISPQVIVTSAAVYDIRGRKISEVDFINQANYQIDLSTLESALYFIEIATESGTITKRIVKL